VKVWTHLGTCLLTGAALSLASSGASAQILKSGSALDGHGSAIVAIAQGGEGGEGGEKGSAASLAKDDAAYLTHLGLVRGHLDNGVDRYRKGAQDAAKTHMKHPGDELYADLAPTLDERGAQVFGDQLENLATLVENGAPVSEIEQAHKAVLDRIVQAEATAFGPGGPEIKTRLETIVNLVRTAAEEYEVAVKDGEVVNAHEYQDALGFVRVAERLLEGVSDDERRQAADAIAATQEQLDAIAVAWPSLVPPGQLETDPSLLHGAAARIEIASLSVK
jgi:hypothetical protein